MLDDAKEMDFEEEKDKVPRNITLTILKIEMAELVNVSIIYTIRVLTTLKKMIIIKARKEKSKRK